MRGEDLETVDVGGVAGWRRWLKDNHLSKPGVWLVFHRAGSGVDSISYDEALDEGLAYGWIDSVIRKLDHTRYVRKFTPRRPGSIWSSLNVARVGRLKQEGRMTEWGLKSFSARTPKISLLEQYNAGMIDVSGEFEAALKRNRRAWKIYQDMAPSHRKRYAVWIAGAKRPETRKRRIAEAVRLVQGNVKNLLK